MDLPDSADDAESRSAAVSVTSGVKSAVDNMVEESILDISRKSMDFSVMGESTESGDGDAPFRQPNAMDLPNATDVDENRSNSTAVTASVASGVTSTVDNMVEDSILDISGKSMEFFVSGESTEPVAGHADAEELYLYKNMFNLIPKSVVSFTRLRNLKFFGNEINLFPAEVGGLGGGLESLQAKISSPGFNGMGISKLKRLKKLELSRVPPRPSVSTLLSEIARLKCLTKLSVCYFSIRYLPPEIGCLKNLEFLDLSFNKIKRLPIEICNLNELVSLKVANNKLVALPPGLSSLQRLKDLDLSSNRLTSLGSLQLSLMPNLHALNLQYNRLMISSLKIPSWVDCNLDGNGRGKLSGDESISSSFGAVHDGDDDGSVSYDGRWFGNWWRLSKRWRRRRGRHCLQQGGQQEECLNNSRSRKRRGEEHAEISTSKASRDSSEKNDVLISELNFEVTSELTCESTCREVVASEVVGLDDDKTLPLLSEAKDESSGSVSNHEDDSPHESLEKGSHDEDKCSQFETNSKSKRHSDRDLNPKPFKAQKAIDYCSNVSRKYSVTSFCGMEDYLPDGFYDAGRNRPFMALDRYEQMFPLESREVLLVDRGKDEELYAIASSAQAWLVSHLKHLNYFAKEEELGSTDNLLIASLLALFVSDHFGGSDRSSMVESTRRKAASGFNYYKPFVCTCSTGNSDTVAASNKTSDSVEDIGVSDLCDRSLQSIMSRRNSIVVPLGTLQFGVCRHRAVLMKYLCDRMKPPVPCELVRGYLDFMPHAWNTILIKRGGSQVRMVVDACHPHDIREETDPEYFSRYIPLSRTKTYLRTESSSVFSCSFPSMTTSDEMKRVGSSSIIRCKLGSMDAAAKVRTLEVNGASSAEVKNFEYGCLGEVRMLGVLKHPCIVEMFGHQISSKWGPIGDEKPKHRILQSAILMEYIKGGSLKNHIGKLAEADDQKHVPLDLALCIARDVASALVELHSKHIIHRDIKSENILIDLDEKRADGSPIVKLCDFDMAVPLRSPLHTCCIAHLGIHPPNVCVGTPRWMAPEVVRAIRSPNQYGLEVDIWSFGCLIYELLTLKVPYSGLTQQQMFDLIEMGKRPRLTEELEELEPISESEILGLLVNVFHQCTEENPRDRPTAQQLYDMLLDCNK